MNYKEIWSLLNPLKRQANAWINERTVYIGEDVEAHHRQAMIQIRDFGDKARYNKDFADDLGEWLKNGSTIELRRLMQKYFKIKYFDSNLNSNVIDLLDTINLKQNEKNT